MHFFEKIVIHDAGFTYEATGCDFDLPLWLSNKEGIFMLRVEFYLVNFQLFNYAFDRYFHTI